MGMEDTDRDVVPNLALYFATKASSFTQERAETRNLDIIAAASTKSAVNKPSHPSARYSPNQGLLDRRMINPPAGRKIGR
jgi:hypothetical protein